MVAPHRRSRAAITAVFAANGALFASLYSRLPTLQAELGLTRASWGWRCWPHRSGCAWLSWWWSPCAWSPQCSRRSR
ncbi:MAG: hypothetical protein H0U33_09285 [Solirubrobacterales bacterium]|nr:hypothetical protein [Solirubrobacterales bacterium]